MFEMTAFTVRENREWNCWAWFGRAGSLCSERRDHGRKEGRKEDHLASTPSLGAGANWAPMQAVWTSSWEKPVLSGVLGGAVFFHQKEKEREELKKRVWSSRKGLASPRRKKGQQ